MPKMHSFYYWGHWKLIHKRKRKGDLDLALTRSHESQLIVLWPYMPRTPVKSDVQVFQSRYAF